jgi:hypothetical protein
LTVLNGHFARRFVTPFSAIRETAIRSLCGGKAESSGCLQIKSRLRATNRARTRKIGRPTRRVTVDVPSNVSTDRVAPVIACPRERAGRVKTAQRRRAVLTRPSVPGQSRIGATRANAGNQYGDRFSKAARVNSIGLAPSNGRIGVSATHHDCLG